MTTTKPAEQTPPAAVKITVAVIVGLILIGVSLFLILGRGATPSLATQRGFLGTRGTVFADINLIAEIILLIGLTVGYGLARRGNIPAHQYNQTTWVLFNIVLTMFIMIVSFNRQVVPGIPEKLQQAYFATSTIHAVLGATTILSAIYILLRMNRLLPKALRTKHWKNLMRVTLGLYWLVGLFGIATYYIWYVQARTVAEVPPTGETTPEPGETAVVPMANYAYVPAELSIPLGTTVLFRNDDPDPHTVTFDNKEFDAFGFQQGDTHEFVFDTLGDFQFYCEFHGSPGVQGMAGIIHVVEAGQIAAVPTQVPPPTATPLPTPIPLDVSTLSVNGAGRFQDAQGRNDSFHLALSGLPSGATDEFYAWLTGAGRPLALGPISVAGGDQTEFVYTDPQSRNLLADYFGFLVTAETAGSAPTAPSSRVAFAGSLPEGALGPARNLLVAAEDTPNNRPYSFGLVDQAEELTRHIVETDNAARNGDVASMNRHIEHMYAILVGKGSPDYIDFEGDGLVNDPGDGFGILSYASAIEAQAQAAAAAPDATENVKLHAGHLIVMVGNIRAWADRMLELGLAAHNSQSDADRQAHTVELPDLTRQMLEGVDANGNGEVEPVEGEGGALTIYFHSQYLAAMGALSEDTFASATEAAATALAAPTNTGVPGATDTPAPTATLAASPTPAGPPVIIYRNFEIVPAETRIKVGTTVVFPIRGSLHQPYNFTAPNVFEAPPNLGDGTTFQFTFNEAGTTTILCGYHSNMQGTVVVEP